MKRTALKTPTIDQVRAFAAKPRKAIPKVGRKAKREEAALAAFRHDVKQRAGGYCEAPWSGTRADGTLILVAHSHTSEPHNGAHSHHVWPEDHDRGVHDPDRGLYLCAASHSWSHLNPDDAKIVKTLRPEIV